MLNSNKMMCKPRKKYKQRAKTIARDNKKIIAMRDIQRKQSRSFKHNLRGVK